MRIKKLYIAILLISIVSSLFVVYRRTQVEAPYNRYEIIMDYDEIKNFADFEGKEVSEIAKQFLEVGINSFAISENTIDSLKIHPDYDLSVTYHGLDMHITGKKEILDYIRQGIERVSKDDRNIHFDKSGTLIIPGKLSDFAYGSYDIIRDFTSKKLGQSRQVQSIFEFTGLGFLDEDLKYLTENHIPYTLRPVYTQMLQDPKKSIDRYFEYLQKYPDNSNNLLIFGASEMLGGDQETEYFAQKIKEFNLIPVAIETSEQDGNTDLAGMKQLAKLLDYKFTRLFSTYTYIQDRYNYKIPGHQNGQEIMNSYYRAITERNIRVIYFRVFRPKNGNLITDMSVYKTRLDELKYRLATFHSIYPVDGNHELTAMSYFNTGKLLKMIAMLGVVVSGLIVFDNIFKKTSKFQYFILAASAALIALASCSSHFDKLCVIFGLISTVTFASLSITYLLSYVKQESENSNLRNASTIKQFFAGSFILLKCVIISLIGTLFLATLYANSMYMLEFSKFSGVKISQLLPLIITAISFLAIIGVNIDMDKYYDKNKSMTEQLRILSNSNVKVWQAAIAFAMLGALAVMVLRSGHSSNSIEPSSTEILMRNIFEYIFPARPRNKAIYIGYPSLIIMMIFAYKNRLRMLFPIFALAATIGQSDILNTFSHIRTPYILSLKRVAIEYVFSVVLTFVLVMLCHSVFSLIQKRKS